MYILKLIFTTLLICSCGEFFTSPYETKVDSLKVSDKNLQTILSSAKAATANTRNYSIAVLSDTHDYYDELEEQVEYINKNSQRFEFVIVTGDLSNVGLVSEFMETKKRLDRLVVPYIITSGNHDLLINGKKIYPRIFGQDTFSFVYGDNKFILYNNNNWESSADIPNVNWLQSELVSNTSPNLFVFSHVPPDDGARFSSAEINSLAALLGANSVDYYINGHKHSPAEATFGGAIHITAGSTSKRVIFELKISTSGVSHEFIKL